MDNSKIEINQKAPVKCSKAILIDALPEKVWAVLTDVNHWAEWQTDISNPRLNGVLRASTTFDWKTGGASIHSTLHTVDPYQEFGWTGRTLGIFAIHNWILVVKDGQTQVVVEESMEGFLAKLFKRTFNQNLETGMQKWLDLLKKTCEN